MSAPQVWLRNAIEAAAGCDAYPVDAPDNAPFPYVVYERSATSRPLLLSDGLTSPAGGSDQSPTAAVTIQVFSKDYLQAWAKSDAIVGAIHGYAGTDAGATIESCFVSDEKDATPIFYEGEDLPTYVVEIAAEVRWS